jgi:hypothetical protein
MKLHPFLALSILAACELSLDPTLDGKRCDSEGACLPGYVCSAAGICEREGQQALPVAVDASSAESTTPVLDAGSRSDAAVSVLDAAQPQSTVPPATTVVDDPVVDPTQDSGVSGLDAGRPDAGQPDAGQPDAGQPDAGEPTAPDAGVVPPVAKPGVMMPTAPPSPGAGVPPPPGMMGTPPNPMECSDGRVRCLDGCVDLRDDDDHCGACFNACRKHESCESGSCKKPSP